MKYNIQFKPLSPAHLPLLCMWLQEPHVKEFYDKNIAWSEELVHQKFGSYIEGFKFVNGLKKPIHAFIIYLKENPIGYAQYYNAYDFPREGYVLSERLRHSQAEDGRLAAMDIFIGDREWIGKGIGSAAIQQLLQQHVWEQFNICLVDPAPTNRQAIRAYEKAGFVEGPANLMFCHKTAQTPIFIRTG